LPGIDYRAVRDRVDIGAVLDLLNFVPSESSGDQLRGPCPIHGSQTPTSRSFSVHMRKNAFRCFRCGASGNQIDLWAAVSKTETHAATVDLCEKLGIDIPWIQTS
jgi:DNA primase